MKTNKAITLALLCFSAVSCSKGFLSEAVKKGSSGTSDTIPQNVAVDVKVSAGGSVVFDSTKTLDSSFKAQAGQKLSFVVNATNCPAGATVTGQLVNTWLPNSPVVGSFSSANCSATADITTKDAGVHTLTVTVHSGTASLSEALVANITCASPTFTLASISGASSALTATGSYGALSYSGAGVVAGANGQAPYRCAFDFNGDGIPDSELKDCSQAQTGVLSTYVDSRPVSVIVADACNTAYSVSKSIALAKITPAMPGDDFIEANVTAATGCGDNIRVKGVHYLADNKTTQKPCDPKFGGTSASIECMQTYGLPYSQPFGMKVNVAGLSNYDLGTNNGVIDATNAKVTSISYVTDEGGDSAPKLTFTGNCTTSTVNANVINVKVGTCANNPSARNNSASVQVWGTYTCAVANSCGTATITGSFSGVYNLSDSCSGGQGQGGDPKPTF